MSPFTRTAGVHGAAAPPKGAVGSTLSGARPAGGDLRVALGPASATLSTGRVQAGHIATAGPAPARPYDGNLAERARVVGAKRPGRTRAESRTGDRRPARTLQLLADDASILLAEAKRGV